ncbi:uncharacterized protein LOC125649219 [Ostrea edulis]|uniref:uncharacterized protein LOC125649219 n=1 Tax=Ostrea edulis TaxID=37623 RepID=UPI0020962000|nr:uncharacterized protein LOC125649219 [Ostrea edulis]
MTTVLITVICYVYLSCLVVQIDNQLLIDILQTPQAHSGKATSPTTTQKPIQSVSSTVQSASSSTSHANTTYKSHRLPCTQEEIQQRACLNGGTCFVLMIDGRSTHCLCREHYYGSNCYYYYPLYLDWSTIGKRSM